MRKWVPGFTPNPVLPAHLMERTVGKSASPSQCEGPVTYDPTGTAHTYTTHLPCSRQNSEHVTYACMHAQLCPTLCHPWAVAHQAPLSATPWAIACQAPLSMGFSSQEYWNGLPLPPQGIFNLDSGIEPKSLRSPALAGGFFTTNANIYIFNIYTKVNSK